MSKAFLIYGSTGAGKSTYAKKLAQKYNSQVFSIDEWMKNLFWMDSPRENKLEWALERVSRCETQIWITALRLLKSENSVVFDLGFSKREQRQKFTNLLQKMNIIYETHFLDINADIRWDRVEKRNTQQTETFQFEVSKETFEWMESYFERPLGDENIDHLILS